MGEDKGEVQEEYRCLGEHLWKEILGCAQNDGQSAAIKVT